VPLVHGRVVVIELGVEQLHHPRLDDVRQLAGDDHGWTFTGHLRSSPVT
jgi:hypothetical protein